MLVDRREELTKRRIQTVNRLQRLLAELTPGTVKKDITALQAKATLSGVRPRDLVGKTRKTLALGQLAEMVALDAKIKASTKELKALVLERGSSLMGLTGVGPVVAARILADVGDVARFADRNRFASWTGTAPLDPSSGEQNRHRLSRAGNRKVNHVIHIAAACQIRLDTPGRAYYRRKLAAGKRPLEAMRCLIGASPTLCIDSWSPRPELPLRSTPTRVREAPRGVSRIQRGWLAPAHQHFGEATSRTRANDATRAVDRPEETKCEALAARFLT